MGDDYAAMKEILQEVRGKLQRIDNRLNCMEVKLDNINNKLDNIDDNVDKIDANVEGMVVFTPFVSSLQSLFERVNPLRLFSALPSKTVLKLET